MAQVRRFDSGELSKPVKEPNGWVRVDAYLTRTGVFTYQQPDGTKRLEYRPPAEVFNTDSLRTFEAVPFTNNHPPSVLDASNTKQYQVGHLMGAPVQDGNKMRATILVTDAATVADMEKGKLEISNGYLCELEENPGVSPDGERYDAIQKNIVGNHVALVDQGRAGSDVRARMDATDAMMIVSTSKPIHAVSAKEHTTMVKIKFDGVEVEVSETIAQLIEKERAALTAKADAAKSDAEKATAKADAETARADGLTKDAQALKAQLAEAPAKVRAEFAARAKLEENVRKVCGSEAKTDGVDDKGLRKLIAATQAPVDVKLDEKSDAYLDALVDLALKKADESAEKAKALEGTKEIEKPAQKPKTYEEAAAAVFKNAARK